MALFLSLTPRPFPPGDGLHATSLRGASVVFLHAHPDDEAIFTGVTMRRLANLGARVILVTATDGALGLGDGSYRDDVATLRRAELEAAASCLGVARLVLLGRRDSGMAGWPENCHRDALANADMARLARRLARICEQENAVALVHYDSDGIYRHPDHLAVHCIGRLASRFAQITDYESTVDREHLHFAGEHLVERASAHGPTPYGRVTAEIGLAVAGTTSELDAKRDAMAAHKSQISPDVLQSPYFRDLYQLEWYVRAGSPSVLDQLGNVHAIR